MSNDVSGPPITTGSDDKARTNKMQVEDGIDEGLYSRQLYVLGREAMQRMSQSNVLIVGLKGLGAEIAKNVALAGVKSIALYDPQPAEIRDLSSQYFITEEELGQPRAKITAPRLAELNSYVPICVVDGELTEQEIVKYQVIVITESEDLDTVVKINNLTHHNDVKFIYASSRGLFGSVFVDFGAKFTVVDPTGEEPLTGIVSAIEPDGTVAALDETRHGLEDGDWVKFSEVQGISSLNDGEPREVKVTGPYTFNIGDVSNLGKYDRGGIFTQVKKPQQLFFKPLLEQLDEPEYLVSDFAKFDRPGQLHIGFLALHGFANKNSGRLPKPYNEEDANQLVALAKNVAAQYPKVLGDETELDEKLIRQLAFQAQGDLAPMASFLGGLVAQEVLKACSGKFVPVKQWVYFDSLESLPADTVLTEEDTAPVGSRYDGNAAVFGRKFLKTLGDLRIFLVGSGAIGCEMLKNWALLGVGAGINGKIIVTDNDSIEKSNLNRQFLFRPVDVGKLKSQVAAAAATKMNPDLAGHIEYRSELVGTETENVFNDDFWKSLDFATNALDNVEARTYIDRRCVFFKKPLLESGTLGTKGNVQVVIPDLTESYSSSQDPPEKSTPLCTLRSFPNKIDHTIAWSKSLFMGYFKDAAENVNLYLSQPNFVESTLKQSGDQKGILETIQSYLVKDRPLSFEECIVWARLEFERKFSNDIKQLLYNFPVDAVTSTGTPFWSGPKRAPTPLKFDINNEDHFNFIKSAANLRAFNYGLKGDDNTETYVKVLTSVKVPEFSPSSSIKIQANDNEPDPNAGGDIDQDELGQLAQSLPPPSTLAGFRLVPVEFEKDDDSNYHIDFITAASNLRALNYSIETADRSKTKFIAGRIIPAIATTTSLVTGLVCLELPKVVDAKKRKIEDFKNGFVNLALPFFGFSEPIASSKLEYNGKKIDKIWGRFDVHENVTLRELIDKFKKEEGLAISMLSSGTTLLYASFYPPAKVKDRLNLKLTDLLETVSKQPLPGHTKTLIFEICADDKNDEDVEVPFITLHV